MGNWLFKRFFVKKEVRIIIMGLDAAGKTSTLYTLKLGEVINTIPTNGFNVETLDYKHISMTAWDFGGRERIRPLLRHYYLNTQGLVFVVDSNDRERLDEALEELYVAVDEDALRDIPILVLANKQDIPSAVKPKEIMGKIHEEKRMHRRNWVVFGVCAVHKENNGLFEAFDWLATAIVGNEKNKMASNLLYGAETVEEHNIDRVVVKESERDANSPFYTGTVEWLKRMIMR